LNKKPNTKYNIWCMLGLEPDLQSPRHSGSLMSVDNNYCRQPFKLRNDIADVRSVLPNYP